MILMTYANADPLYGPFSLFPATIARLRVVDVEMIESSPSHLRTPEVNSIPLRDATGIFHQDSIYR